MQNQLVFSVSMLPARATGNFEDLMGDSRSNQWVEPDLICPTNHDHGIIGQDNVVICYQCLKYWDRKGL